jgi:ribosomal protein S18 acetylase RimI-like enzyme
MVTVPLKTFGIDIRFYVPSLNIPSRVIAITMTGVIPKSLLTQQEFAEVRELSAVCNSFEGLDYLNPDSEMTRSESNFPNEFLYYENGTLAGFLSLYILRQPEAYLVVHPRNRRKGIGTALLRSAKESCKDRGLNKFLLVCEDKSISGKAFVEHLGAQYLFSEYRMKLQSHSLPNPQNPGQLKLQRANEQDTPLLAALLAQSFNDAVEEHARRLTQDIHKPTHRFYIAKLDEKPVGCLGAAGDESKVYVIAFGVLPEYRGRGFGRWMLTQIARNLGQEDWSEILIEVRTDNLNALSLYRSCGFMEITSYKYYDVQAQH